VSTPHLTALELVDLKAQYRSIDGEVAEAFARVLQRQRFVDGDETGAFEKEFASFCQARDCIAVSSGTAALELTLQALGGGPGDEIVTVSHTFFATVSAIVRTGATPVFVDVDELTWTLDSRRVAAAITDRTKAIVPVHLYGHPADIPAISAAAPGIPIVEDAAQAHGASYYGLPLGAASVAACFSFYPGKNLGAYGDAGAVVTSHDELAARLRSLRDHGRGAEKYEHGVLGTNARMSELQAAVLRAKLPYLCEWTDLRRRRSAQYELLLTGMQLQAVAPWAEHARHLFVLLHPQRDGLRLALHNGGIATGIHYPIPAHRQKALTAHDARVPLEGLPVTDSLAQTCLSLPLYPELDEADVERVADAVWAAVTRVS
jgi:dTDP-4-amino-4,6-dideoxygalactose transaminase